MPNIKFTSFLANYKNSIVCKKVRFCIPKTVLNFAIIKILLEDGYIKSFWILPNKYEIVAISLSTTIQLNWVTQFSTSKWHTYLTFDKLLELTKTGGYYIISTKLGVMNDSDAWFNKIGGKILFAIF